MKQGTTIGLIVLMGLAGGLEAGANCNQGGGALTDGMQRYKSAERFLEWNKDRYVRNGAIRHFWVDETNSFWYRHQEANETTRFTLFDAINGLQTPAFDHKRLANALSLGAAEVVQPERLPFEVFAFADEQRSINFVAFDKEWFCSLTTYECNSRPSRVRTEAVSPDGNWVAFVKDHNVHVRSIDGRETFALTTDGERHFGYAEEFEGRYSITRTRQGEKRFPTLLWSPDSKKILTHRLDERDVKSLHLSQSVPEDGTYRPILHSFKYAMAGDPHLPQYEPVLLDIQTAEMISIHGPMYGRFMSPISMGDIWWSSDGDALFLLEFSRYQRKVELYRVELGTSDKRRLIAEESSTNIRLDPRNVSVLANGDFIWISARDGFPHLYLYSGKTGELIAQLTRGAWVARDVIKVDQEEGWIYLTGADQESGLDPYFRKLYRVRFDGTGLELLTSEDSDHEIRAADIAYETSANNILWDESRAFPESFSPSGDYFIDIMSRADLPAKTVVRRQDGTLLHTVVEEDIVDLQKFGLSFPEPFAALAADGETVIYGNLFRPTDFDPELEYPVIDAVYPGPQVIRTKKRFNEALFDGAQAIAELGFVVVTIDGRGTPLRGKEFIDDSYGHLGKAGNLEDHISALRQLAAERPYMNLGCTGIYGSSGGGYAAARGILQYPDFFKVAVSSSGNHDQRGYSYSWGELYNGPEHGSNYEDASNAPLAGNLKGQLFLIHGDMDDNVHPALTMQLVDALIKENKDFELLILPNESHSFKDSRPYFERRRWDYFVRNLLGQTPPPAYRISAPPK